MMRSSGRSDSSSFALLAILLLAVILMGCGTGRGADFTKYKGTDGLVIEFLDNAPPKEVYENRPFPVKFTIKDAGAFDVNYTDMVVTFSYDPLYISSPIGIYNPERYDTERTYLSSKAPNYPAGEERLFSIPTDQSFIAKQVYGQREQPQTEILASVCYAYTTYLATEVCIDTNMYDQSVQKDACKAKDLTFTGGQGAPITIDRIEVAMLPVVSRDRTRESVQPEFRIHIKDVGKGYLVGPDTLPMQSACLLKEIPKAQLNSVLITAYLHNTKLECGPDDISTVKLVSGEGEISCTIPERELTNPAFSVQQNYDSMLIINLTYLYKTAAKKQLEIKRSGNSEAEIPGAAGKAIGYLYTGDQLYLDDAGRPVTLCTYYAQNPGMAPENVKGRIGADYSCSCGSDRCLKLSKEGKCVFGDVCPSNTYCCNDRRGTTGATGVTMDIARTTVYYTADCGDYPSWSSGMSAGSSLGYCELNNKGFYEDVKCQGSGVCKGKFYSYSTITRSESSPTAASPLTSCGTVPQAHHTIAVNTRSGTECYVPPGSVVRLDFGEGNPWNGEYVAEDKGSAITGCRVDVYAGEGRAALRSAEQYIGNKPARLTILDSAAQKCS